MSGAIWRRSSGSSAASCIDHPRLSIQETRMGSHRFLSRCAVAAVTVMAVATTSLAQSSVAGRSRGAYLAAIMDCGGCHTGGALAGQPDQRLHLAGSAIGFGVPGLG